MILALISHLFVLLPLLITKKDEYSHAKVTDVYEYTAGISTIEDDVPKSVYWFLGRVSCLLYDSKSCSDTNLTTTFNFILIF